MWIIKKIMQCFKNAVDFMLPFDVFSTVHHSIELFHRPTLMYNFHLFINNMFVTLLSSTCFEH